MNLKKKIREDPSVTEIEDHAFSIMKPLRLVGDKTEFFQTDFSITQLVTLTKSKNGGQRKNCKKNYDDKVKHKTILVVRLIIMFFNV